VNALADRAVAAYLEDRFVVTYLKVGTFRIVDGQKQGGNVASYFCLPDGRVLHAIAGPVDAHTMLRETRWAVDMHKLAAFESGPDAERLRERIQSAHQERAQVDAVTWQLGDPQQRRRIKVHELLSRQPLAKAQDVFRTVFEDILGETVSNKPVDEN
jgi:hypothetical protein